MASPKDGRVVVITGVNEGIIHNVSSGAGLVGHPGLTGYASTKGAIEALVRSLREPDCYHLYIARNCPRAHGAALTRRQSGWPA